MVINFIYFWTTTFEWNLMSVHEKYILVKKKMIKAGDNQKWNAVSLNACYNIKYNSHNLDISDFMSPNHFLLGDILAKLSGSRKMAALFDSWSCYVRFLGY